MIKPEIHSVCGSGVHRAVSCSFGEWRGVKFFENGREVGSWVGGAEGVEWKGGRVVVGTEGGVVVFERGEEWKCVEGIEVSEFRLFDFINYSTSSNTTLASFAVTFAGRRKIPNLRNHLLRQHRPPPFLPQPPNPLHLHQNPHPHKPHPNLRLLQERWLLVFRGGFC